MADGIVSFPLPSNPKPSARLRDRFNDVSKELNIGLTWEKDIADPLQVNASELSVDRAQWEKYEITQKTPTLLTIPLHNAVLKVLQEVERQRHEAVKESAHSTDVVPMKIPVHLLSKTEAKVVQICEEVVGPLINSILSKQSRPDADSEYQYIRSHGDADEQTTISRSPYDTCLGLAMFDPKCSPLPYFPDLPPINGMIAPEISMEAFLNLGKTLPPDAEELRPTTVLEMREGKVVAIPLPLHPKFVDEHQSLAGQLERMAMVRQGGKTLDKLQVKQLLAWAKFFQTGKASDERAAVQATIDAGASKSRLRIHIGPSESYWKDNTKFPYLLQVGIRDPQRTAKLTKAIKRFQALEASLAGTEGYRPRSLSPRGGFVDVIHQAVVAGFLGTFPLTEPAGNNFPNYEAYNAEGGSRFVLMDSVLAGLPRRKQVTAKLTDEDLSTWNLEEIFPGFVIAHEAGHSIGPQRGHVTPSGNKMGAVFGKNWGSADEPKADLTIAAQAYLLQKEDAVKNADEIRDLGRAYFTHLTTRYKGKAAFLADALTDHYFGVTLQVAYLAKAGVLTVAAGKNGKTLQMDAEKWAAAGDSLWRTIIQFQAKGDVQGYLDFAKNQVSALPDELDQVVLSAGKGVKPFFFVKRQLVYHID